ncbi:EmrB/QacA subfamily drug resistance transporter [Lipingzhangella halophila]|uniref:EmrB/QacA subfamily drug resistance transporter n=1 Tax=Lipingzhangella halophila TaxID=1783352 RepID=A0A7W7RKI7_9ACTN|nr:MFS transporter [Lipingzhangella halophila]MBB4933694.1 EmrB/QacA subfamily drug resistance transporter [Lipingzhangella halophila]
MNVQLAKTATAPSSPRLTLLVVAFAAFLTMLDNTIVTVALPSIRAELGLSLTALEWVATGYILTFSSVLLTGGRLADVFGRRVVFLAGFAVFSAASLAAGLAGDAVTLVAARMVQGLGAGLLLPATLAILSTGRDERQRSLGVAVWMAVAAGALALGPVLGGVLSQHAHWSWIFLINVPVGVAAIAVGRVAIPESRAEGEERLDLPGLVTSSTALAALTFALVHVPDVGWAAPRTLLALVVAGAASAAFVAVERRAPFPMVVPSLFVHRVFSGGVASQVLWGLGVNGVFFFTAIFLQDVMGFSPTGAGLAFLPLAALIIAVAPCAPALARRFGANVVVASGLVLVAVGIAGVTLLQPHHGYHELVPVMMTIGVGSALTTPLGDAVLGAMPERYAGVASGVFSVSREVSGIFGIAAVGVLVTAGRDSALAAGHSPAEAFMHGYSTGLFTAAALVAAGAVLSLWALPRRGR